MANKQHVERLRAGVKEWNAWRSSHPKVIPDFAEAKLASLDLTAPNAPDTSGDSVPASISKSMIRADLRGANFNFSHLDGAKLIGAFLDEANFAGAQMVRADLSRVSARFTIFDRTNLSGAKIRHALLYRAHLSGSDLSDADLSHTEISNVEAAAAVFERASLRDTMAHSTGFEGALFDYADLTNASCIGADFRHAKLRHAILRGTNLEAARLVDTDLSGATLVDCSVHGVAAWDLVLDGTIQSDLIITKNALFDDAPIRVDDIQIAHFLHLLIDNQQIRRVVDSVTAKVVLILGRFTPSRKSVLDAVRGELKRLGYVPVLFDFDKPSSRDLTETVSTIAHLSRFVLVDLTDAKSVPQELSVTIPFLPSVPIQPIAARGEGTYAMFEHFRRYPWVLPEYVYSDTKELLHQLEVKIIPAAERRVAAMKPRS